MVKNRILHIGSVKDNDNRKYIAVRKNDCLVIHIAASENDRINIHNYSKNCITNIQNKTKNTNNFMNTYFNSLVKYISEEFDKYEELHIFVSRFVYAYRMKDLVLNSYNKFIKDNILFSFLIDVDEIYENEKAYKFKKFNRNLRGLNQED